MKQIPLTKGKFAIIDAEDFKRVNQYKWFAVKNHNCWYAIRTVYYPNGTRYRQLMHRFILGFTKKGEGPEIDHENHNGLDNKKNNLRTIKSAENQRNMRKIKSHSSIYKGVHWSKWANKWAAQIMYCYKSYWLGYFDNEIEAAQAYDIKAIELFGDFACLNFCKVQPPPNDIV